MTTELTKLERQVERASLFAHTALSENADHIHEIESILYGLLDILVQKGAATSEEITAASANIRAQMDETGETTSPGIALRVDADQPDGPVTVNCAERMHICKAICCKLRFALTSDEVEARHNADGFCTHNDRETGACGVYENRPAICRTYSCANDTRIWSDFENMVLNEEWIEEHLGDEAPPQLLQISMFRPEVHAEA
jgi:Fe-S-cluster containining protein